MAQRSPTVWRLHADLTTVTYDLLHHARRRVRELQPSGEGTYEFARGNEATTELGVTVFDLYVRYLPTGEPQ